SAYSFHFSLFTFHFWLVFTNNDSAYEYIKHRCQEQPDQGHAQHTTEYRGAKYLAHFRTGPLGQHQRDNTENECKCSHQDGAQANLRCFNSRFNVVLSFIFTLSGKFHHQDCVFTGQSYQYDKSNLGKNVIVHPAYPYTGERKQNTQRYDQDNGDRQGPAFILCSQQQEYKQNTERKNNHADITA